MTKHLLSEILTYWHIDGSVYMAGIYLIKLKNNRKIIADKLSSFWIVEPDCSRQNLTSIDVRLWRLKSISTL